MTEEKLRTGKSAVHVEVAPAGVGRITRGRSPYVRPAVVRFRLDNVVRGTSPGRTDSGTPGSGQPPR